MSSRSNKTLKSGKTLDQNLHPKMSLSAEDITEPSGQSEAEEINTKEDKIFSYLIEERLGRTWSL